MKRVFFSLFIVVVALFFISCSSSMYPNCPSYAGSYGKEKHKITKGINKNVFANGIKAARFN